MLLPAERVVAGISGGVDSVCLLLMLSEWRRRYGLDMAAVHVNHGIRPEAAEDARFVQELCKELEVPFFLRETDIRGLALEQGCSEEEAGRNYRYQAFREIAGEFGADKIAVAHNLNDRGETMLFHLFRGTGIRGLAGIPPVRDGVIRPLLCAERREIERYLAERGQDYCRDATNEEDTYTRNRIRHHILSYAEQEIVSGCVRHMGQTAELLAETEDYMEQQTLQALERCVEGGYVTDGREDSYILNRQSFLTLHPAIQKRMLYKLLKDLSPGARDIARVHVEDIHSLFVKEGNRCICLPFGIRGSREYEQVVLSRGHSAEGAKGVQPTESAQSTKGAQSAEGSQSARGLQPAKVLLTGKEQDLEGLQADFQILSLGDLPRNKENSLIFPQNEYTKWFDYDKIKESPVLRTRVQGDYLTIRDGQGRLCHKKLKDYMVTEKIPAAKRERLLVLAEGSHVLWLVGYRISEYYKVGENTKRVLQVQLMLSCGSSGTEEKNGRTY
ncbi:MAG: tRNA lysidine(34) synthetase TilS [Butyrivibrio sp.]|nr:tRNA lysidine(34) synthetase TilS [Butyrivibrio sp.]